MPRSRQTLSLGERVRGEAERVRGGPPASLRTLYKEDAQSLFVLLPLTLTFSPKERGYAT